MAKTCFVIMPITTPPETVSRYHGDADHFQHVLDHLFTPALAAAGYNTIPPAASGADLIHAEIVKNLELADLVLCDVSTLNANVFFELGIRTALDRPLCMVKDQHTANLPFDTAIINFYSYDASLSPWTLKNEIERLRTHVSATEDNADGRNALWRYFGLTRRAETSVGDGDPVLDRLEVLASEIQALRRERTETGDDHAPVPAKSPFAVESLLGEVSEVAKSINADIEIAELRADEITFDLKRFWFGEGTLETIRLIARRHGYKASFVGGVDPTRSEWQG